MSEPSKGVRVELDRTRHLRYPLSVLRDITEDGDIVSVLWAGLKHEDPGLTKEQVGEMVDLSDIPDLVEPLKEATGGIVDLDELRGARLGNPPEGPTGAEESTEEAAADS